MTIEIEAPDGSIVEFPDGTPDDVMAKAMRSAYSKANATTSAPQAAAAPVGAEQTRAEFSEMPWYQKPFQAADDLVRLAANGMTFGYADKLAGALDGTGTEAERRKSEEAQARAGGAGTVAELGGAIAMPMAAASKGLSLAGRFGTGAMKGGTGLLARSSLMGAEGAGYGALTAAGHDNDIERGALLGAIFGGAGNMAVEGVTKAVRGAAGMFNKKPNIPTSDELKAARDAAYKTADEAGVTFAPQAVESLNANIADDLTKFAYHPDLHKTVAPVLSAIRQTQGGNPTLSQMETLRRLAGNGMDEASASGKAILSRIIERIDDAVANPAIGDVIGGDSAAGAAALKEARNMHSRVAKTSTVEKALEAAELNAGSTGTGGNTDNATRQQLKGIARNANLSRGFTPDENEALKRTVMGTAGQNFLRHVGKLAPTGVVSGGVGFGGGAAAGSFLGGPAGATVGALAVPTVGRLAKMAADRMTQVNAQELLDIIATGGTRAAARAPGNAVQRFMDEIKDPVARAVMSAGANKAGTSRARNRQER